MCTVNKVWLTKRKKKYPKKECFTVIKKKKNTKISLVHSVGHKTFLLLFLFDRRTDFNGSQPLWVILYQNFME